MINLSAEMLDSFLAEAWEAADVLGQAPRYLANPEQAARLGLVAHRLHGSAGLYGYPQVAGIAGILERVLSQHERFTSDQTALAAEVVQMAAAVIAEALTRIMQGEAEGDLGLQFSSLGGATQLSKLLRSAAALYAPEQESALQTPQALPASDLERELREFYRQNRDMWEFFAPEVIEHLEAVNSHTQALTQNYDPEVLQALFRAMHTLKGAAYSVGCKPIGVLAHQLEDLLVGVRSGQQLWSDEMAEIMLRGADVVQQMLFAAEGRPQRLTQEYAAVAALLSGETPDATASLNNPNPMPRFAQGRSVRVGLERLEGLLDVTAEAIAVRSRLADLVLQSDSLQGQLLDTEQRFAVTASGFAQRYLYPTVAEIGRATDATPTDAAPTPLKSSSVSQLFSELEFDRYDDLSILARSVEEMAADLSQLRTQMERLNGFLRREAEGLQKLTRDLRMQVAQMRLVPLDRLFQRLRRLGQGSDKRFRLVFSGENLELDAPVLEGLSDPLVHLVNNAIAHGIESPNERVAKGKPPEGLIEVRAIAQGNSIYFEVQDDGVGIDFAQVENRAIELGLLDLAKRGTLSQSEIEQLLFLPGFTTSLAATATAGRGVGLDVVRENLRSLKGDLTLHSALHQGTLFRLRVPLSLVVTEVLMVEVGTERLALPREAVRLLQVVEPEAIQELLFAGQVMDVMSLAELLGLPSKNPVRPAVVILEGVGQHYALTVDAFAGVEQAVVRPLPMPFGRMPHLSGALVGASGRVVLMLDPVTLPSLSRKPAMPVQLEAADAGMRILLADDSLSVRRVVGQILSRLGHQVETAIDGVEAFDKAQLEDYDLVITDLEMPRMSGFELIENLKRLPHTRQIPVFVLTSRASEKHERLARELGANAYLSKPLNETQLRRLLLEVSS